MELPAHSIIGLVGPNGSGKTTTLKLMAGWLRPTRGTVAVGGQPLVGRLSHPTVFAPDGESLYPFFTVAEHVDYAYRVGDDFRRDRADEALKFLSVPRESRVGVLSRGQRARVKLALMLARTCPLILLDEPLAGLDPAGARVAAQGIGVVCGLGRPNHRAVYPRSHGSGAGS